MTQLPTNDLRVYIWVRKNLPSKEQFVVQAAHAALEAGIYFGEKTADPYTICLLEAKDEETLKEIMRALEAAGISYKAFI